jgi:chromosomal replication initiation ATPase DnaA
MIRLLGPTPADVLQVASEMTGIPVEDIIGRRSAMATRARLAMCWAARSCSGASYPEIARALGLHYETIIDAVNRVEGHPEMRRAGEVIAFETLARCEIPAATSQQAAEVAP